MKLISSFKFKKLLLLLLSMYSISNVASYEKELRGRAKNLVRGMHEYKEAYKQVSKSLKEKANAAKKRVFVGGFTTAGLGLGYVLGNIGKPRSPRGPKNQHQSLVERFKAFKARRAEYSKQNPIFARTRSLNRGLLLGSIFFTGHNLRRFGQIYGEREKLKGEKREVYQGYQEFMEK
jgi:hypothetical protein